MKLNNILIGKATGDQADLKGDILSVANGAFKGSCPLWTYILAEAMANQESVKIPVSEDVSIQTPRLGPVGGRIVAEVFLGLMFGDPHSMLSLNPDWCPRPGPNYKLKDLVNYAYTIRDKIRENELVMKQIANNSAEQAMLGDFSKAVDDAIMDSGEAHQNQMMQLLSDPLKAAGFAKVIFDLLKANYPLRARI